MNRSEAARRAGWSYRIRARQAVDREIEALEAWDPVACGRQNEPLWYQERLRRDRDGNLGRARAAARQAADWARTPDEAYRAALLVAYLDSDAGDHKAELQQAQRMMALRPHEAASIGALLHAAKCNGLKPMARRAAVALKALREGAVQ